MAGTQAPGLVALGSTRTWFREKVHRKAVAEVFITDAVIRGPSEVLVSAQTPTCHSYFGDHVPTPAGVDPLLLMEVCRQAGLATAYELGIPLETTLATGEWDLTLTSARPAPWGEPNELSVLSRFDWTKLRGGKPRSGVCVQEVTFEGSLIAELTATSIFLSPAQLAALRASQRNGEVLWSNQMKERSTEGVVAPSLVGRLNPNNVVLADLAVEDVSARARVVPSLRNKALFDHAYDHVTMQILGEAARQVATARQQRAGSPNKVLIRQRGTFARFAELDAPIVVNASFDDTPSGTTSSVAVEQSHRIVATFDMNFVPEAGHDG